MNIREYFRGSDHEEVNRPARRVATREFITGLQPKVRPMLLLTQDEMAELSGRRQPAAQMRWLLANGWKFQVGADGRPKVLRIEAERRMVGSAGKAQREMPLGKVA